MAKVTALVFLCALALCTAHAGVERTLGDDLASFVRELVGSNEGSSKRVCVKDGTHLPMGLPKMCLVMTLSPTQCYGLNVSVEYEHGELIFERPIDLSTATPKACATGSALGPAFTSHCGNSVTVCAEFPKTGNRALRLAPGFVAGGPQITIAGDCEAGHNLGPYDVDDFVIGKDCEQYSGCDQCLEHGCGWCTAGYAHSCMAGSANGPDCGGACGDLECQCNWFFEKTCPYSKKDIDNTIKQMNETDKEISTEKQRLMKLEEGIKAGGVFGLLGKEYECELATEEKHEHSAHTTVTVVVCIITSLVGLVAGVAVGKAGYLDMLLRRGGGDDGPNLYQAT